MSARKDKKKQEEEEDDVYVVEAVINKRRGKDGGNEYLLRWQGFPIEEATWEPEDNVSCPELIAEYERKATARAAEKREKRADKEGKREKRRERDARREADEVMGATNINGDIQFLIKFKDGTADLVAAKEANVKYTPQVLAFYERNLKLV